MVQQPLVGQRLLTVGSSQSHSVGHTTLSRIPLNEWSALRRDLYLTTHNTHKRQTSMPPEVFEPTIPTSERPLEPATFRISIAKLGSNGTVCHKCAQRLVCHRSVILQTNNTRHSSRGGGWLHYLTVSRFCLFNDAVSDSGYNLWHRMAGL